MELDLIWVETVGDRDKKTSLRFLEKTDFFTRELDQMVLAGTIEMAIHSAKDLPDPLPQGLSLWVLTAGLDPRDSLVFRRGFAFPEDGLVATSSSRREGVVRSLYPKAHFVDLRGTIGERLALLEKGVVDGVVVAEAALIRLQLTHLHRQVLPGETALHQGRLALIGKTENRDLCSQLAVLHRP